MEKIEEFDDVDDAFRRLEQVRKEKYPQHYREIRNIKYWYVVGKFPRQQKLVLHE